MSIWIVEIQDYERNVFFKASVDAPNHDRARAIVRESMQQYALTQPVQVYVLEKCVRTRLNYLLTGGSAPKRVYWPVEAYTSRKACKAEADKRNSKSRSYEYRCRPRSLKVIS